MVSSNVDKIIEGAKIKSIPEDELKRRFFAGQLIETILAFTML